MITAKCNKCGGTAFGETFVEASKNINHAVALSRGIKCGDNYNMVCQVDDSTPKKPIVTKPTEAPKQVETPQESEKPKETEKPKSKSKSIKSKFKMK